ncbi:heme/hemin ABC transporter substrate-binding protein [Vibrio algarum]|uniref:ABC transporter substrate-binding protein n=1 Tax=Vibrio algarum TaxID=3020714 RepID=A0ABT4YTP8_9VIBR|nr:ABC transporter substrate-binding protein [Vibrio sp. KJ40-1]MDB1124423.1 ABC transporter substrate-binding protein [Vibrio sp. KJ40-1]
MRAFTLILSLLLFQPSAFAKERIISAGSVVTELIYALGAEQQLVAVDVTSKHLVANQDIPQVGYHRQLSAEGLLALHPSYLVGSNEMGPDSTLENLKSSHVNVLIVPPGNSTEALYQRIDILAELTGTTNKALELKQTVKQDIDNLTQYELTRSPKVIFLMLSKGRPATVGGKETTVDKIITLSGATNPANEAVSSYKPLSMEAVVALQPDYILVSERAWKSLEGHDGIMASFPLLAATPAGQPGKILSIPSHALIGGFGIESIRLSQKLRDKFNQDES